MSTPVYATERELAAAILAYRDRAAGIRNDRVRDAGLLPLRAIAPPTARYIWQDDRPPAAYADIPQRHPEGEPAEPREVRFILGVLTVCTLVLGGLLWALYIWAQRGSLWR